MIIRPDAHGAFSSICSREAYAQSITANPTDATISHTHAFMTILDSDSNITLFALRFHVNAARRGVYRAVRYSLSKDAAVVAVRATIKPRSFLNSRSSRSTLPLRRPRLAVGGLRGSCYHTVVVNVTPSSRCGRGCPTNNELNRHDGLGNPGPHGASRGQGA